MILAWWKRLLRPTLVRRLLMAQMLLLTVIWSLLLGYVSLATNANTNNLLNSQATYNAVLNVIDNLVDAPAQRRYHAIYLLDLALREEYDVEKTPELAPALVVRQGKDLIYQSEGAPVGVMPTMSDAIQIFHVNGVRWKARTDRSKNSDISVTISVPSDKLQFFITLNSHGYYILPLLISLPFLLIPAWLSLRFGLRPWSKVVREIAMRGPEDLRPLSFKPKHLELRAMVDSIDDLLQRVNEGAIRERYFIADAAHELRTPLAAMRINAEALQSKTQDPRDSELLDGIMNSSNRATRLVRQLLQLMRSDTNDTALPQKLMLDALLQDRLAALSPLASLQFVELELTSDSEVFIMGKREDLESLIDNLIENAIKYSPPHDTVTVQLHSSINEVLLSVSDNGPGIGPALRERVFDRFFRAPDQTQNGSGLGLSIAKAVVTRHGGKIRAQMNDNNRGALVIVTLPLAVC
ncbi:HAMP domain-containing sensor histidine kinase [Glaciimonas sp. PCH181]|uniref:sensor histidine kinase n=1 Tax=Glaciimonas sp. PCH181 TaxID=2133943 RepID=UPI000D34655B|nr:ATP-binding protein [Glaciimonas sp. PCH181]PUA17744.1 two-component sensor histidine kinase [Glaciimonas sp. PCH181]